MSEALSVMGIAIVAAGAAILLKQYKPEYAFGVSIASAIIFLLFIIAKIDFVANEIGNFISASGINTEHYEIVFRCLGICLLTNAAAETCKDCGQSSIASKVVIAGKAIILVMAFPLFSELMNIVIAVLEIK